MRVLFKIIQVGPRCLHECPYKNETEKDNRLKRKRRYEHGGRDWSDEASNQGM